jgi:hypothetical protein
MRSIDQVTSRDLVWVRPSSKARAYELRAQEDVIATLRWQKGTLAEATAADGDHWTFKRAGFWHPRVTVRAAGSEVDLAVFRASWTGSGVLELPPGRAFHWSAVNFWRSRWAWHDADGQPLALFKSSGHGRTPAMGRVEIAPAAAAIPELTLLLLLGWYLMVLRIQDESDSTGAIVAVMGGASVHG